MKTRRSWRNQNRMHKMMGDELKAAAMRERLFTAKNATGISYCDTKSEEHGDYRVIGFLPYRSLELEIRVPTHPLVPLIRRDASTIIAMRGQAYQVTTSGQTVTLGQ